VLPAVVADGDGWRFELTPKDSAQSRRAQLPSFRWRSRGLTDETSLSITVMDAFAHLVAFDATNEEGLPTCIRMKPILPNR
jgi:hypothetical protein